MQLLRNGMGDLISGHYPIPQNPIMDAVGSAVTSGRARGVGDLVTGSYPVPFNPIVFSGSSLDAPRVMMADTSNALASSVASLKAGPTATLTGFDLSSVTDSLSPNLTLATTDFASFLSDTTFGLPNIVVWGGGLLLLRYLFANKKERGTSRFSRAKRAVGTFSGGSKSSK